MASLQVGSGQISQRVDPGLVDPRLLGADLSRIGMGIGQGMGMVNDYYAAKENAAMRPIRRGLADMQLAAAQEKAAGAENRRALADLDLQLARGKVDNLPSQKTLRDIEIAKAQRQADIDANTTVVVDELGNYLSGGDKVGGYWSSPDNRDVPLSYTDQESGKIEVVYNPVTKQREERRIKTGIVSGKDVAIRAADRAANEANAKAKIDLERKKFEFDIAREKASASGKDVKEIRYNLKDGGIAVGWFDEKGQKWVTPPMRLPESGATDTLGNLINSVDGRGVPSSLPTFDFRYPVVPAREPIPAPEEGGIFSFSNGRSTPSVNPATSPFTGVTSPVANPTAASPTSAPAAPVPTDADVSAAQKRINELKGGRGIVSLDGSPLAGLVRKPTVATPRVAPPNPPNARTQKYIKANEARQVRTAEKTLADIELLVEQGGKIRMARDGRKSVVPLTEKEAMKLEKDRLSAIKILGLE